MGWLWLVTGIYLFVLHLGEAFAYLGGGTPASIGLGPFGFMPMIVVGIWTVFGGLVILERFAWTEMSLGVVGAMQILYLVLLLATWRLSWAVWLAAILALACGITGLTFVLTQRGRDDLDAYMVPGPRSSH